MSNHHDNYTDLESAVNADIFATEWAADSLTFYVERQVAALAYANEDTNVIHHERDMHCPWETARHYGEDE